LTSLNLSKLSMGENVYFEIITNRFPYWSKLLNESQVYNLIVLGRKRLESRIKPDISHNLKSHEIGYKYQDDDEGSGRVLDYDPLLKFRK